MHNPPPQFWFRSDRFSVEPLEDKETNPFCYGKQLAEWVSGKFRSIGYVQAEAIPEDWGWCALLERRPFLLWIGCGNVASDLHERVKPEDKSAFVPQVSELTWTCFVGTDVPIWTPFFWKRLIAQASTDQTITQVANQLEAFLRQEQRIQLIEEP